MEEDHKDMEGFVKIETESNIDKKEAVVEIKSHPEDKDKNELKNETNKVEMNEEERLKKEKVIKDIKNYFFNKIPDDFGKTVEELEKLDSTEIKSLFDKYKNKKTHDLVEGIFNIVNDVKTNIINIKDIKDITENSNKAEDIFSKMLNLTSTSSNEFKNNNFEDSIKKVFTTFSAINSNLSNNFNNLNTTPNNDKNEVEKEVDDDSTEDDSTEDENSEGDEESSESKETESKETEKENKENKESKEHEKIFSFEINRMNRMRKKRKISETSSNSVQINQNNSIKLEYYRTLLIVFFHFIESFLVERGYHKFKGFSEMQEKNIEEYDELLKDFDNDEIPFNKKLLSLLLKVISNLQVHNLTNFKETNPNILPNVIPNIVHNVDSKLDSLPNVFQNLFLGPPHVHISKVVPKIIPTVTPKKYKNVKKSNKTTTTVTITTKNGKTTTKIKTTTKE